MNKLFAILLAISLFSCSSDKEIVEPSENQVLASLLSSESFLSQIDGKSFCLVDADWNNGLTYLNTGIRKIDILSKEEIFIMNMPFDHIVEITEWKREGSEHNIALEISNGDFSNKRMLNVQMKGLEIENSEEIALN